MYRTGVSAGTFSSPITVTFVPAIRRMKRNTPWMIRRELTSFVMGENFPMIHSTSRIGMERIRYPTTVITISKKRIISVTSL